MAYSFGRNPHAHISSEPLTREEVKKFRRSLENFWEDTWVVTEPNSYKIILLGNLIALCDTLLECKDFDNPQLMMGDAP